MPGAIYCAKSQVTIDHIQTEHANPLMYGLQSTDLRIQNGTALNWTLNTASKKKYNKLNSHAK